jgi:hypothetical protein
VYNFNRNSIDTQNKKLSAKKKKRNSIRIMHAHTSRPRAEREKNFFNSQNWMD